MSSNAYLDQKLSPEQRAEALLKDMTLDEKMAQVNCVFPYGGVEYEDFTNVKKNGKISTLGNDASQNMQINMKESSWINVRKVDFGNIGAASFTLRAKGTGTMEIRTGTSPRTKIATIEFSSEEMADQTFEIPAGKLKGVKNNLYLFVTAATGIK